MPKDPVNRVVRTPNASLEQCSICLDDFINQEIGMPETCRHSFCYSCLIDWTKTSNTCPQDRQTFQYILRKESFASRKPYAKLNITDGQIEAYVEENVITCEECGESDKEYSLLACIRCSNSYHPFCLNSSDTESWICPSCEYVHGKTTKSLRTSLVDKRGTTAIKNVVRKDQNRRSRTVKPCRRLQQSTSQNLVRRDENSRTRNISLSNTIIRTSGKARNQSSTQSVLIPNVLAARADPQSAILIEQARNMALLKRRRERFSYLPPRLPMKQLPRIQRRADAPSRPCSKALTKKSNIPANASFIDKLLHAQENLLSLGNIQMHGAQIQLS